MSRILKMDIEFGPGSRARLAQVIEARQARRAFLMTSRGMLQRSMFSSTCELVGRFAAVHLWADVPAEPEIRAIESAAAAARACGPDVVVAYGGGSVIDAAKLVAVALTNDVPLSSLYGVGLVPAPPVAVVAVPTLAGSGSEVTAEAVVTDRSRGTKFAIKDSKLLPTCAIVDPDCLKTCAPAAAASGAIDALTHAIEAFTGLRANAVTDVHALEAASLLLAAIPRIGVDWQDLEVRTNVSLGALLAGIAFGATGTAAVHACGYPLSGRYGLPHGLANGLMLPIVVTEGLSRSRKFRQLAARLGIDDLPRVIRGAIEAAGLPTRLRDAGIPLSAIGALADVAAEDRRHLDVNAWPLDKQALVRLFDAAW